jgi:16S rRNA processing protein RimM
VVAGRITGVYGIKGWVKVCSFTEPSENIFSYRPWWVAEGDGWRCLDVESYHSGGATLVAHISGVDDRDRAHELCRRDVLVERSQFPALESGEHYWRDLIGLAVYIVADGKQVPLGSVVALMETGANDVMVISGEDPSGKQRERLIPFVDQYLKRIDLEKRAIEVDWDPEF